MSDEKAENIESLYSVEKDSFINDEVEEPMQFEVSFNDTLSTDASGRPTVEEKLKENIENLNAVKPGTSEGTHFLINEEVEGSMQFVDSLNKSLSTDAFGRQNIKENSNKKADNIVNLYSEESKASEGKHILITGEVEETMGFEDSLNKSLSSDAAEHQTIEENSSKNKKHETFIENTMSGSLKNILDYTSDSSKDSEADSDSDKNSDSESSEESSDSESSEGSSQSESSSEDVVDATENTKRKKKKPKDEESWLSLLGVDEALTKILDISSLDLNEKDEFVHMGYFQNIIDKIGTVAGLPQMPAYDVETLLFLEEGKKCLGSVIDVMGLVTEPIYIIPLNSEEVDQMKNMKGAKVYCAPRTKYTKYVLIDELKNSKGSDASWVEDVEVPSELKDFSDDEQERKMKQRIKRKINHEEENSGTVSRNYLPGALPNITNRRQNQQYNSRRVNNRQNHNQMNNRPNHNQINNRPNHNQFRNNPQIPFQHNQSVWNPFAITPFSIMPPPVFNPNIPPPNFRNPK